MEQQIKRIHAIVHGRVQGVFFRETTRQEAEKCALSGWVRNLPDGTVETEFQGGAEAVERLLSWLPQGSPYSRVSHVDSKELTIVPGEKGFDIRF